MSEGERATIVTHLKKTLNKLDQSFSFFLSLYFLDLIMVYMSIAMKKKKYDKVCLDLIKSLKSKLFL